MKMLKGDINKVDLINKKQEVVSILDDELTEYVTDDNVSQKITFPIYNNPQKVKSINFEKRSSFENKLVGIKGQYLIFENDEVFNVRRHKGYVVNFSIT